MKTSFLKDVKKHKMTILQDNGVYRHIRFKEPGTSNHYFDLVTYPGHLVASGDMGDYVFARLDDMFNFFSTSDNSLKINLGYWTEKLTAISKFGAKQGSINIFSPERTLANLKSNGCIKDIDVTRRKNFCSAILNCEDEREAVDIMGNHDICDSWEYLDYKPTFHIQWILYAIRWGIMQYEKDKEKRIANLNKIATRQEKAQLKPVDTI